MNYCGKVGVPLLRGNGCPLTFLGGEPFLQARGLAVVAEGVSRAGLSVITFTGYTVQELHELSPAGTQELLAWTDVLVDGPYEISCPDNSRNWVGSTNQKFHYLTDRYNASIEGTNAPEREVEWRIRNDWVHRSKLSHRSDEVEPVFRQN